MWNRNRTFAAIGLILAGSFFAGLLHLLALRAETGAFYPPYSTFRADPLGARAFYESLRGLPGLRVERNLAPIRTLGSHREITCLFLGDSPADELPESVFKMVEEIPSRGGRLVIAFAPQAQEDFWRELEREAGEEREGKKKESEEKDEGDGKTDAEDNLLGDPDAEPEEDTPAVPPEQCPEAGDKSPSQEGCNQISGVGIHPRNAFRRSTPAGGGHHAARHEPYGSAVDGGNRTGRRGGRSHAEKNQIFEAATHKLFCSPRDGVRGGRLVQKLWDSPVSLLRRSLGTVPVFETPEAEDASTEESEEHKSEEDKEDPEREYMKVISLEERWGAGIAYTALAPDGEGGYTPLTAKRAIEDATLPESLPWHSAMYFKNVSDAWRTIYTADERPVVIERDLGTGTIVLISDSFPFSNEALRKSRYPGLLAWVVGDKRRVIFDETHLGIQEGSGVMVLARQYRMHGLFIGLVLLALLYVWKSASPLAPRYQARGEGDAVVQTQGRDAVSGLANLLKRSIPASEVLNVCMTEWRQAFGRSPRNATKLKTAETIVARTSNGPLAGAETVEAYRNISTVLSKRGR